VTLVVSFLQFNEISARIAIASVLTFKASNTLCEAISSEYGFEFLDLGNAYFDLRFATPFLDSAIVPLGFYAFS
jgi:hypothetical protein